MSSQALSLVALFFLSSFAPRESALVFATIPPPMVYTITWKTLYYGKSAWETVRFAGLLVRGRLSGWTPERWVLEATARLDHHPLSTKEHTARAEKLMEGFGHYLGWTPEEIDDGRLAAGIHDLGKLCIPTAILEKPGPLTPEEMAIMRLHLNWSVRFTRWIPGFARVAHIVADHHEWFDGSGYPKGTRRNQISRVTHALAIVDAYDAMTHDRYYRQAMSVDLAFAELRRSSGTQFDPDLVEKFIDFIQWGGSGPQTPWLPFTPGPRQGLNTAA